MTDAELFNLFFSGGNYSKHYLIKFTHPTAGTLRFVNDNVNVTLDGEIYSVSAFSYTQPDMTGTGGNLEISSIDNSLIEFLEKADEKYTLTVVGIVNKDGSITKYRNYKHFHGSISYGADCKIVFTLSGDDRLELTFSPYTYDTENNPGNA